MSFSTELAELMGDTVTVASLASWSTDGSATPVYGSAASYTARVVRSQRLVRSFTGEEEVASVTAWVRSTSTFDPSARYTLPDGTTPELLALESYPDESGAIHHVKLRFA